MSVLSIAARAFFFIKRFSFQGSSAVMPRQIRMVLYYLAHRASTFAADQGRFPVRLAHL
jgi:hypothetical protein